MQKLSPGFDVHWRGMVVFEELESQRHYTGKEHDSRDWSTSYALQKASKVFCQDCAFQIYASRKGELKAKEPRATSRQHRRLRLLHLIVKPR